MEPTAFNVTKSTIELYKIRHASGCYWADITIDANGRTGRISIASDYGNWSNYWGACGSDFKTFLAEIGYDYAASKFDVSEWVDVAGTIQLWKELVCGRRRDDTIVAEEARAIWRDIESMASETRHDLLSAFDNTSFLSRFIYKACGMPEFAYEPDPRFKSFWKQVWPVLLAELAREREAILA
jgi:hypothetical protein